MIIALLVVSWIVYDYLWRSPQSENSFLAGLITPVFFVLLVWGLAQMFSGRAVFVLMGAVLGSVMMGNIWFRLLPALKEMADAREEGRTADENICGHASVRSTHNSYLIFPTVVLMLSNHYPVIYSHHLSWVVLSILVVAFILARHLVVSGKAGIWALVLALAGLGVAAFMVSITPSSQPTAGTKPVSFTEVRGIIIKRCLSCHSTVPSDRTFGPTPGGISFDRPEDIKRHAQKIKASAVESLTMPNRRESGHESNMTAGERKRLGQWVADGAKLE